MSFDSPYMIFYFYCNYVSILHRFWDIRAIVHPVERSEVLQQAAWVPLWQTPNNVTYSQRTKLHSADDVGIEWMAENIYGL